MVPSVDDVVNDIKEKLARMDKINCIILALSVDTMNYVRYKDFLYKRIDEFELLRAKVLLCTIWMPRLLFLIPGLEQYLNHAKVFAPTSRGIIDHAINAYRTGEIS